MKRVIYSGETLLTGTAVANTLLHYAQYVIRASTSVSLEIPVLEPGGEIAVRQVLLGPATQLESRDADDVIVEREDERFPVPELPAVGGKGVPSDIEPFPEFPADAG